MMVKGDGVERGLESPNGATDCNKHATKTSQSRGVRYSIQRSKFDMSKSREEELEDLNKEGQAGGSENKYEPPHGVLDMVFPTDEKIEENEVYDKGWDNGYKQR
jgi:hypothetical protein